MTCEVRTQNSHNIYPFQSLSTSETLIRFNLIKGCMELAESLIRQDQKIAILAFIHIFTGVQILEGKRAKYKIISIICNTAKFLWLCNLLIRGNSQNSLDDGCDMLITIANICALSGII